MRQTVRDAYIQHLEDKLESLRKIKHEFELYFDMVRMRDDLRKWRDETAEVVARYGIAADVKLFRNHVNFEVPGFSGEDALEWFSQYDELLVGVIAKLPTVDVRHGYADDVRIPLEQIDELLNWLGDCFRRSMHSGQLDYQTAEEGLRRWKDHAYKIIDDLLGEDEAGRIYEMKAGASWGDPDGSVEEQYDMYLKHLVNLKDDIQKHPHHLSAAVTSRRAVSPSADYVHASRLRELRAIRSSSFNMSHLIALCEELNTVSANGAHHATAMLVRVIMDHVPPIFGQVSFAQVASNYSGSRSFRDAMANLESAARKIGDAHLHTQICNRETLPTSTQVNFSQQIDMLLGEIVRTLK